MSRRHVVVTGAGERHRARRSRRPFAATGRHRHRAWTSAGAELCGSHAGRSSRGRCGGERSPARTVRSDAVARRLGRRPGRRPGQRGRASIPATPLDRLTRGTLGPRCSTSTCAHRCWLTVALAQRPVAAGRPAAWSTSARAPRPAAPGQAQRTYCTSKAALEMATQGMRALELGRARHPGQRRRPGLRRPSTARPIPVTDDVRGRRLGQPARAGAGHPGDIARPPSSGWPADAAGFGSPAPCCASTAAPPQAPTRAAACTGTGTTGGCRARPPEGERSMATQARPYTDRRSGGHRRHPRLPPGPRRALRSRVVDADRRARARPSARTASSWCAARRAGTARVARARPHGSGRGPASPGPRPARRQGPGHRAPRCDWIAPRLRRRRLRGVAAERLERGDASREHDRPSTARSALS